RKKVALMKTELTTNSVSVSCSPNESAKLASLLALAAGAVALPQSSNADIIFTDLSANPIQVGFLGGGSSYNLVLPGSVLFGFQRYEQTVQTTSPFTTTMLYRAVTLEDKFG